MKNLVFCFFLFALSPFCTFSQNSSPNERVVALPYEYYDADSARYFIRGEKDTFRTDFLHADGTLYKTLWGKDSLYTYSILGKIVNKYFYDKGKMPRYRNSWSGHDSAVYFFANGQIRNTYSNLNKNSKVYFDDGRLKTTSHPRLSPVVPDAWRVVSSEANVWNERGLLIRTTQSDSIFGKTDTLLRTSDTLFYENGRLKLVKHLVQKLRYNREFTAPFHVQTINERFNRYDGYDSTGKLLTFYLPDSANLVIFKDNIACYYGLKNGRGDTIIAAKYDHIEVLDLDLFAAYRGDRCEVIRGDAKRLDLPQGLTFVTQLHPLSKTDTISEDISQHQNRLFLRGYAHKTKINTHFLVRFGKKIGVINREGAFIIPPQYEQRGHLAEATSVNRYSIYTEGWHWVNDKYLMFNETKKQDKYASIENTVVLNLSGQPIFDDDNDGIQYAHWQDLFVVTQRETSRVGLANGQGEFLLKKQFSSIKSLHFQPFYIVTPIRKDQQGLYDAAQKRWILDTSNYQIQSPIHADTIYDEENQNIKVQSYHWSLIRFKHCPSQKMGLLDNQGQHVVAAEYDSLLILDQRNQIVWFKKGAECGILKLKESKIPQFTFENLVTRTALSAFAQKNGKWGMVDNNGKVMIPFEYDYIGTPHESQGDVLFVKNGVTQQLFYDKNVLTKSFYPHKSYHNSCGKIAYDVVGSRNTIFIFDTLGRILLPPQYQPLSDQNHYNFIFVLDKNKRKKLILLGNMQIIDFPFDYAIEVAKADCPIIIVSREDTIFQKKYSSYSSSKAFGVVSKTGKELSPCKNFEIAIADTERGIYMVQPDTPRLPPNYARYNCNDSLVTGSERWFLYDSTGKLLSQEPFSRPFSYQNGRGLGIKNQKFGIYRPDGKLAAPPQYAMAWNNTLAGLQVAFDRVGLQTRVSLFDKNDKNRLEKQVYDGISYFMGKYALVSAGEKVGLIDTLGNEIIAPQDLYSYTGNLMDSMFIYPKQLEKKGDFYYDNRYFRTLPHDFRSLSLEKSRQHIDSFKVSPTVRNAAWNLMLKSVQTNLIFDINQARPDYVEVSSSGLSTNAFYRYFPCHSNYLNTHILLYEVSESFMSWQIERGYSNSQLYNFYYKNKRWEALTPLNFWKNTPLSKTAFYEALVVKIRQLKDVDIDCGDPNSLVSRAQSQFSVSQAGVKVFLAGGNKGQFAWNFNLQSIVFTWTEIQPFLQQPIGNQ